jgi:hypothetical protein
VRLDDVSVQPDDLVRAVMAAGGLTPSAGTAQRSHQPQRGQRPGIVPFRTKDLKMRPWKNSNRAEEVPAWTFIIKRLKIREPGGVLDGRNGTGSVAVSASLSPSWMAVPHRRRAHLAEYANQGGAHRLDELKIPYEYISVHAVRDNRLRDKYA